MPRILIVEDEAHILRVMAIWLERHGHEVLEACNGAAALEMLRNQSVDLIISDMNMPVMDGLELIKAVREHLKIETPVLLLTARCDQEQLAQRMEPYSVRLYSKPFTPSRLVADIDRLLGAARP